MSVLLGIFVPNVMGGSEHNDNYNIARHTRAGRGQLGALHTEYS